MTLQDSAQRALKQYIEQLEQLEAEKKAAADDIKEKLAEARGAGFDVKALRQILKMRKKSKEERDEEEAVLFAYLHALDMQLPLDFEASKEAA